MVDLVIGTISIGGLNADRFQVVEVSARTLSLPGLSSLLKADSP